MVDKYNRRVVENKFRGTFASNVPLFLLCGTMILSFSRDVEATCITSREKEGMLVGKT